MVLKVIEVLTRKKSDDLKLTVTGSCGWLACIAVNVIFENAGFHGKNLVYELVNKEHRLVVLLLDSDCSNKSGGAAPK